MTDHEGHALDWLLNFVNAHDINVGSHYFHICDGEADTCGCPLQGQEDVR